MTILIGALVGMVTVAFLVLTENLGSRMYPAEGAAWRRLVVPLIGSLVTGYLLYKFFPEARGSGIPQTKVALFARDGYISLRTAIGKFGLCSASLASGIALGREGPSVQFSAGLASVIGRKLGLDKDTVKALVPVGSAAALAAAFNTPIAAVLFTLEEVVGNMHAKVLGSVVVSAATSWVVLHLFLGDEPLFHVPAYQLTYGWEFAVYALLGVLGGLVSAAFTKLLLWLREKYFTWPVWTQPWQPATGGLFVGLLGLAVPGVLGVGYIIVGQALNGRLSWQLMMLLLVLKLVAVCVCYASGNAGGIFGPSLFLGAMIGGAVGQLSQQWLPGFTGAAGAYALVGMGTAFAGIIRTPFTSVIMIFELTRDYNIIVPLMISNMIAYFISTRLHKRQIYQGLVEQDGIHLPELETAQETGALLVADAMQAPPEVFPPDMSISAFRAKKKEGGCLVAIGKTVWGAVPNTEIERLLAENQPGVTLGELVSHPPSPGEHISAHEFAHVHADQPLDLALHRMGGFGIDVVPVVDRTNPRVVIGMITLNDLFRAYRVHRIARLTQRGLRLEDTGVDTAKTLKTAPSAPISS